MKCKKLKYDRLGAMLALSQALSPGAPKSRKEIRMYFCDRCGMFHLTSQPKRRKAHGRLNPVH